MYDRKSGRSFLERNGLIPSHRNPMPAVSPSDFKVHSIPLSEPLPLPELRVLKESDPKSPDRYEHDVWVNTDNNGDTVT